MDQFVALELHSRPDPQAGEIGFLIDLLDVGGRGPFDQRVGSRVLHVCVADPEVLPALLADPADAAHGDAGAVGAGGEAEGDFTVFEAAYQAADRDPAAGQVWVDRLARISGDGKWSQLQEGMWKLRRGDCFARL